MWKWYWIQPIGSRKNGKRFYWRGGGSNKGAGIRPSFGTEKTEKGLQILPRRVSGSHLHGL